MKQSGNSYYLRKMRASMYNVYGHHLLDIRSEGVHIVIVTASSD